MKLIASSQIPIDPTPYLHMGYVVAAPMNAAWPIYFLSFAMLLVAGYVWKAHKIAFGLLLLLAVACFFWGRRVYDDTFQANAPKLTNAYAHGVLSRIIADQDSGKSIPDDFATLCATDNMSVYQQDGWKHPFHFAKQVKDGQTDYTLTSAGPDAQFGTADDLVWRLHHGEILQIAGKGER